MKIKHLTDIRFTVSYEINETWVDFKCYEISGIGTNEELYYTRSGAVSWPDDVDSIQWAQVFLHGSVKWDGCSDFHFDEQDRVMIHNCCREQLENIGKLLVACWDIAKDELPSFNA